MQVKLLNSSEDDSGVPQVLYLVKTSLPVTYSVLCNNAGLFQNHFRPNEVPVTLGCWLVHPGVAIRLTELEISMHVLLVRPKPHVKN